MTDKGYDSHTNRAAALARGITPVIPRRGNSKQRGRFFRFIGCYQRIIDTCLPRWTEVALSGVDAWEYGEAAGPAVIRLADVSRGQTGPAWTRVSETVLETEFPKQNDRRKKIKLFQ